MDTNNYLVTDSLIKLYDKEGADMPSGIQTGYFPITEFAPTGFGYNANLSPDSTQLSSNDTQITHFGINAGKVLPYVVAPQPYQDIWQVTLPAGAVTYVKLQSDLFSGFSFQEGNVEFINATPQPYVKLDCPRSINFITSGSSGTGSVKMRVSGTDFYERKQVFEVDTASKQTVAFSTISSIRLENTYTVDVTVTIGTFDGIGLPYFDDLGVNFLGASYNFQPLLGCLYQESVFDIPEYVVEPGNTYLPYLSVNLPVNFTAGNILIAKQAVFGFGAIPTDYSPEEFNTDLYSNLSLIIGNSPPSDNWIGWRG